MKLLTAVIAMGMSGSILAQDPPNKVECPMHAQHMASQPGADHRDEVDRRHDIAAVSHESSVHKFVLKPDGGAIELRATDGKDQKTIGAIRVHLREIARDFQNADFSTPAFIHDGIPAGVLAMIEQKAAIRYRFERLESGARVTITTRSEKALAAIHEFLRYQIDEHRAH